jgi:hypothetical protein
MTIETLKTILLDMFVSRGLINDTNQNVKFIYLGKVFTDNTLLLDSLNPNEGMNGQTMQVMITPKQSVGGKRKTLSKRKIKMNKTMKSKERKP